MNGRVRASLLREIFEGSGSRYDEIVAEATGGSDAAWKEELIRQIGSPRRILDLACGTGILSFMIRDRFPDADLVGVDRSIEYLAIAAARAGDRHDGHSRFVLGDAETAAVAGDFDAIVSCYLPKYADLAELVERLHGKLAAGGRLALQDFTYPEHPAVRAAWERRFAALRRRADDEWPEARGMFELLPAVIRDSHWLGELPALLAARGFEDVRVIRQGWGVSALVTASASTTSP